MKTITPQLRLAQTLNQQAFVNAETVPEQNAGRQTADDQLKPGELYLANESVFVQSHFDEPLTRYAVGWQDQNKLQQTLDFLAPPVVVPRRFSYRQWEHLEEFLADGANDDIRAIGGEFPTVKFTGREVPGRTDNRGLRLRVDLDEVADPHSVLAGGVPVYQARAVERMKRRILRNSIRRAVALLGAAALTSGKTWDATIGKDPDTNVVSELVAAATMTGLRPNRVGYGDTAWDKRSSTVRSSNTPAGYDSAARTEDRLKEVFNAEVLVCRERYSAGGAPLAEVVGNSVIMFYAQGESLEDASNIKRFVSLTESGGEWRVYVQQVTGKLVDITVEHYESIRLTFGLGVRKFSVS